MIKDVFDTLEAGHIYPSEPAPTPANDAGIRGMKKILAMGQAEHKAIAKLYDHLEQH